MEHTFGIVLLLLCSFPVMVQLADVKYMKSSIVEYFSQSRHHSNPEYKAAAKDYLYKEFMRFGLETVYQDFEEPSVSGTAQFSNVIGLLKGSNFGTDEDRVLGVVAHYDTVQNTSGVDDNGSGCAALLEVARQVTGSQSSSFQHTVIFLAVDLEESGYVGTQHFIKGWMIDWLRSNYKKHATSRRTQGVFVLDTLMGFNQSRGSQIVPPEQLPFFQTLFPEVMSNLKADGFAGDFLLTIFREPTRDKHLANNFLSTWKSLDTSRPEVSRFEIESFPLRKLNDTVALITYQHFLRSDHQKFWRDNIPAVFLTDSASFRGDMRECYHAPCDDIETMLTDDNLHFLSKTADALSETVLRLTTSGPDSYLRDDSGTGKTTCSLVLISAALIGMMT